MRTKKILFLVHRAPIAPDRGDRVRSYHLLRFLAERAEVHLAALADEPLAAGDLDRIRPLCAQLTVEPLSRRLRWLRGTASLACGGTATEGLFRCGKLARTVQAWQHQTDFDAVLVFCSSMLQYVPRQMSFQKVVVDLVDVDSQKWFDYAANARWPASWLLRLEGSRLRRRERLCAAQARGITLVSRAEAELFRKVVPGGPIHAVANGVDVEYYRPRPEHVVEERDCLFVGALDYRANIDAVVWFAREVWPLVRRDHPNGTFGIVGRNPASAIRRLAEIPGIDVIGQVADVRPRLAGARLAIAPLRIARGIQNKVLEAAAMEKAMVVSPAALEGLQLRPGRELEVAGAPEQWAATIGELLNDSQRRQRLGSAAREHVIRNHSWEACLMPLAGLLELDAKPKPVSRGVCAAR